MKFPFWPKYSLLTGLLLSVPLSTALLDAQTYSGGDFVVNATNSEAGNLSIEGNILDFGTTNGSAALLLQYTNNNLEFIATQPSSSFLWQTINAGSSANKLLLDSNNNLTVFGTNGSAKIIVNPNSGGGITLANSGSIVFADGTVLSSAYGLNGSGGGAAVAYNGSGGLAAGGDTASAYGSLALGFSSWATGIYSTAIGTESSAGGAFSMALGEQANASGNSSTALGSQTTASGSYSTAFGQSTGASGQNSTAFGNRSGALGTNSTAFGYMTIAGGLDSTAFGYQSIAVSDYSTAFGVGTYADGELSTSFGLDCESRGMFSTAFGNGSYASGVDATAIGSSRAIGYNSTSFGIGMAQGDESTAFGVMTVSPSYGEIVLGQYNVGLSNSVASTNTWITNDPVLEIGNGVRGAPGNAVTILKNGSIRAAGTIESPSGVRIPQTGDMNMGSFTNGNSPATLSAGTGLVYPGGN